MKAPDDLLYSKEHEWIQRESDIATIGITEHAQKELGDVVFADLPEVGTTFKVNEAFGSVESVKAVSEVYMPVSGEVVETNESLLDAPEKINDDPYGEGWIIRIRLGNPTDLETLMSSQEYSKYVEEESQG
ncbi:MAG: glycine cleavage system protein GcvH [Acidobacteria bacterium]|nr:glycine cleavage system protein GcvH [Acidobacteriota bacterium]